MDIDKDLTLKLNLIVDRYLKLDVPFKSIKRYLTGKNIDKVIGELSELRYLFLKKNKDKDNNDFKLIVKNKIIDIIKDREYNFKDKNEKYNYIKDFKSFNE